MGNAYIALTAAPGGDGGGSEDWPPPPPPPPGFIDYYIGRTYKNTAYTISASFNISTTLAVYNGLSVSTATGTSVSISVSSGFKTLYLRIPNTASLTGVTSLTLSGTSVDAMDFTHLEHLTYLDLSSNSFTAAEVEAILTEVDSWGTSNGTIDLTDNTTITLPNADKTTLEARGWTVSVDGLIGLAYGDEFNGVGDYAYSATVGDASWIQRWAGEGSFDSIAIASEALAVSHSGTSSPAVYSILNSNALTPYDPFPYFTVEVKLGSTMSLSAFPRGLKIDCCGWIVTVSSDRITMYNPITTGTDTYTAYAPYGLAGDRIKFVFISTQATMSYYSALGSQIKGYAGGAVDYIINQANWITLTLMQNGTSGLQSATVEYVRCLKGYTVVTVGNE